MDNETNLISAAKAAGNTQEHAGGPRALAAPPFTEDVALRLTK